MNFYYCQSKWKHAVIEAKNVPLAKDTFVEIINSNLEDNKKISVSDVKVVIVNVYHKGSKAAQQKRAADACAMTSNCKKVGIDKFGKCWGCGKPRR